MFERFTEGARQVIVLAQEEARTLRHDYIGTEHLLLGLLRQGEGVGAWALKGLDVTLEAVRAQVAEIVGPGEGGTSGQIPFTPRTKKVLDLALRAALALGHNYIGTEHILLALAREKEGVAARILVALDADAETIDDAVIALLSGPGGRLQQGGAPEGRAPVEASWEGHVSKQLHGIYAQLSTMRPLPIPRPIGRRLVQAAIRRHDPEAESRLGPEAWDTLVEETLDANPGVDRT